MAGMPQYFSYIEKAAKAMYEDPRIETREKIRIFGEAKRLIEEHIEFLEAEIDEKKN